MISNEDQQEEDDVLPTGADHMAVDGLDGGNALLVEQDEEEEDEDEPMIVRPKAEPESTLLLLAADEDDEFDEPLEQRQVSDILLEKDDALDHSPAAAAVSEEPVVPAAEECSIECKEALEAITEDPWDISSWMILLDEAKSGHSGDVTAQQAYDRLLKQFPRSAKLWMNYSEYFLSSGDAQAAEEVLSRGSAQCWNVDLWLSLLALLRNKYSQAVLSKPPAEIAACKAKCEQMFERSLEQLGLSLDSLPLWRSYLDFLADWPEVDPIDAGKKINAIRKAYHKVLCTPVDGADLLWRDYELYEKARNEAGAESVLFELNKKHQHSRSILRERKRLAAGIVFDRFATPPTNAHAELAQLDLWSAWISYELSCPDYLNADSWRTMARLVFQQCLTCFLHHAEVWLAFARFEQQIESGAPGSTFGVTRGLLLEAIEANPSVSLLRIALAELEESSGGTDVAKEVLRDMFQSMPSGFTFSLYQRFVRRTLGLQAARRLFSETAALRLSRPRLSVELYTTHATLELEVNCQADVALRILDAALSHQALCLQSIRFLRLYVRALLQTGDANRLRYIMQCALEAAVSAHAAVSVDGSKADSEPRSALSTLLAPPPAAGSGRITKSANVSETVLRKLLVLFDLYLHAEVSLGRGDLAHLDALRDQRQRVRALLEDDKGQDSMSRPSARRGLFDASFELLERCDGHAVQALPAADQDLRERCRGRTAMSGGSTRGHAAGQMAGMKRDRNSMMGADFHLSAAGLPTQLRDLLSKLPPHNGPALDIDVFVRHMKGVTLPPRPAVDEAVVAQGMQRQDLGDWERADGEHMDHDDLDDIVDGDPRLFDEREEDVFRQRQRMRIA